MFVVKIRWTTWDGTAGNVNVIDEAVKFIEATQVTVHGAIGGYDQTPETRPPTMGAWTDDQYFNYLDVTRPDPSKGGVERRHAGRLIEIVAPDGQSSWWLASFAWLMGPGGQTIERLAP